MSSPRKFAEKIALIQQKQAEGDAAFNTILNEVEAAKQVWKIKMKKKNNIFYSRERIVYHQQKEN